MHPTAASRRPPHGPGLLQLTAHRLHPRGLRPALAALPPLLCCDTRSACRSSPPSRHPRSRAPSSRPASLTPPLPLPSSPSSPLAAHCRLRLPSSPLPPRSRPPLPGRETLQATTTLRPDLLPHLSSTAPRPLPRHPTSPSFRPPPSAKRRPTFRRRPRLPRPRPPTRLSRFPSPPLPSGSPPPPLPGPTSHSSTTPSSSSTTRRRRRPRPRRGPMPPSSTRSGTTRLSSSSRRSELLGAPARLGQGARLASIPFSTHPTRLGDPGKRRAAIGPFLPRLPILAVSCLSTTKLVQISLILSFPLHSCAPLALGRIAGVLPDVAVPHGPHRRRGAGRRAQRRRAPRAARAHRRARRAGRARAALAR